MKHARTISKLMKTRSIQAQSLLKISLFSFSFASVASFCVLAAFTAGGLGLAICLDMALALGGRLRLSRSTDEGSEFRLQLPAGCLLA